MSKSESWHFKSFLYFDWLISRPSGTGSYYSDWLTGMKIIIEQWEQHKQIISFKQTLKFALTRFLTKMEMKEN